MNTWTGRLVRVDLGSGGWALETQEGRFVLQGDIAPEHEGRQIEIEGTVASTFTFLMTGDPVIFVTKSRTV
jgi:hypothetical protein